MNVNLIAVDEAHCISQWGNDFRPSYKNITKLRELQPSVNVVALTASATPEVVDDIIAELDFINPKVFKQSFSRPNLAYMVFHEEDKYFRLEAIIKKNPASSIIYVRNRKATLEVSNFLESKGFTSTYYHGGLSHTEKDNALNNWMQNRKQVIVATNAFGMGIDKPDVKTVVHLNLPESIESYFQEAGRAGRDGNKAYAVILKNNADEVLVKNQFLKVLPSISFIKELYRRLSSYLQIAYGEGMDTTFDFNFNDFCKTYKFNTILAYNTLLLLDRTSIITLSKQFNQRTIVQFIISNTALFSYLDTHADSNIIVKSILRTYGGIFDQEIKVNTRLVADKANVKEEAVFTVLQQLEKAEIITLKKSKTDAQITYLQPREDDKTINRVSTIIKQQNTLKEKQIASILKYINNDDLCKSIQLLTYFGEKNIKTCGVCSVCIQNKPTEQIDSKTIKREIIQALEKEALSSRDLFIQLSFSETQINNTIKGLLEDKVIKLTNTNTYKLAHI